MRLALCLVAGLAEGAGVSGFGVSGFGVSGSGAGDVLVVRVDVVVVRAEVLPFALGLVVAERSDLFEGAAVSGSGACGDVDDTSTVTVPFVSGVTTATTI